MSKKQVLYILSEEVGSQAKKITAGIIFLMRYVLFLRKHL